MHPFEKVMKKYGVRFAGIGSPQEDDFRLLDLPEGVGPTAHPEHSRQTDDTRGMSSAITTINIVAAHDHTGKLLGNEVHLVGTFRATEDAKGAVAMPGTVRLETCCYHGQGFVPCGLTEAVRFADQGVRKAVTAKSHFLVDHGMSRLRSLVDPGF